MPTKEQFEKLAEEVSDFLEGMDSFAPLDRRQQPGERPEETVENPEAWRRSGRKGSGVRAPV